MKTGTIKWFDPLLKYGFIEPDNGDNNIFLHISEIEKSNVIKYKYKKNYQGIRINYEIITDPKGRERAVNLSLSDNFTN